MWNPRQRRNQLRHRASPPTSGFHSHTPVPGGSIFVMSKTRGLSRREAALPLLAKTCAFPSARLGTLTCTHTGLSTPAVPARTWCSVANPALPPPSAPVLRRPRSPPARLSVASVWPSRWTAFQPWARPPPPASRIPSQPGLGARDVKHCHLALLTFLLCPRTPRRAWRKQRRPRRCSRRAWTARGSRSARGRRCSGDSRDLRHVGLPRSRVRRGRGKIRSQKLLR